MSAIIISGGVALGGIALVALGIRDSSPAAKAKRANQLHSRYFVVDRSRGFVAIGALLIAAGGVVAAINV
jgi:hypothetical protein